METALSNSQTQQAWLTGQLAVAQPLDQPQARRRAGPITGRPIRPPRPEVPLTTYATASTAAYKQQSILTAPPGRLVVMLYDGACASCSRPPHAMREGDRATAHEPPAPRRGDHRRAARARSTMSAAARSPSRLAGHLRLLPAPPDRGAHRADAGKIDKVSRAARPSCARPGPRSPARLMTAWADLLALAERERAPRAAPAAGTSSPALGAERAALAPRARPAAARGAPALERLAALQAELIAARSPPARDAAPRARRRCDRGRGAVRGYARAPRSAGRAPAGVDASGLTRPRLKSGRRRADQRESRPTDGAQREVHGRTAPSSLQGDPSRAVRHHPARPRARHRRRLAAPDRRWPPTSPTPTRPATSAWTSTSTARSPRRWARRPARARALERTAFTTAGRRHVGAVRADGSTVDVDAESAKLAANALEHQAAVQVAARAHRHPPTAMGVALMGMFDGLEISARPHRRAAAHGRHGGEPRQRPDHARRRRPAVPPQGGRPAGASPRRRLRRRSSPAAMGGRHGARPAASQVARHRRGPDAAASASTTPATRTPTRRATSRCRTSTRSPRWST